MSGDFLETSRPVLDWVLRTTWEASLIAALVLLAQVVLRGRVSARWRYNLWLLVVARLLLPAVPGTHYSPFNLVQLPRPARLAPVPSAPRANPTPPMRLPPVRVLPVPGLSPEPRHRQDLYLASDVRLVPAPDDTLPETETAVSGVAAVPLSQADAASVSAAPARATAVVEPTTSSGAPHDRHARSAGMTRPMPPAETSDGEALSDPAGPVAPPWYRRVDWQTLAAVAWVAGAAFVAARLAWVTFRLSAAVRRLPRVQDPALVRLVAECAARLRLRRLPQVLEAPDSFGPALVGLLRPRIVLPSCVLRGPFHGDELRLILMHELAHMKRWDVAANWLLAALGMLHWFNPVVALTFRRMRSDREMACDELVLSAAVPGVARAYGPTILKLLQTLSGGTSRRPALPGVVGVLEGTTPLRRRIAMIARFDRNNRNSSPLFGVALSVLTGGVALTGAVRGQQAPAAEGATREVAVEVKQDDHDDARPAAAEEKQAAPQDDEAARQARREAEDQARQARREAEDQALEARREAEDQARDARQESVNSANEAVEAARDRLQELQQTLADRQNEAAEKAAEGRRAIEEAREQLSEREAETQRQIDEARKQLTASQREAVNHEQELRQSLAEAKQALVDQQASRPAEGNDDEKEAAAERLKELSSQVEEKEQEVASAASEREQALREANAEIERATGEQQQALREARAGLEKVTGEHQEALAEAARASDNAAGERAAAQQQVADAQETLSRAQAATEPAPGAAPAAEPVEALPPAAGGFAPPPVAPPTAAPPATPAPQALPSLTPPAAAPAETTGPVVSGASAAPPQATPVGVTTQVAPAATTPPAEVSGGVPTSVESAPMPTPAVPRTGAATLAPPEGVYGERGGYGRGAVRPGGAGPATAGYGRMGGMRMGGYGGMAAQAQPAAPGYPGMGNGMPAGREMAQMMGGMGMRPGGVVPQAPARVEDRAARDADARAAKLLRQAMPVNFDNVPLADALNAIADGAKIDIIADWKALEAAGVERGTPVSLTLRQGAPGEQVLTWLLRSAGGDAVAFAIDHGVVVVSTADQIAGMVITRAYDLGSLADNGQGLEQLVRDTVAPRSWRENGGSGSVRFFNGQLFVTATEPTHRQVERLLGLMEAHGAPAPGARTQGMMPGGGGYPSGYGSQQAR